MSGTSSVPAAAARMSASGFVGGVGEVAPVEDAEDPGGGPGQALVAIDERVAPDK
jgi:hypothetical protein